MLPHCLIVVIVAVVVSIDVAPIRYFESVVRNRRRGRAILVGLLVAAALGGSRVSRQDSLSRFKSG